MYHINKLKYFLKAYSYSNTSFETLAYCSKNKPKFGQKVPNFILKIDIPSKYRARIVFHVTCINFSSMQFCFHNIFLIHTKIDKEFCETAWGKYENRNAPLEFTSTYCYIVACTETANDHFKRKWGKKCFIQSEWIVGFFQKPLAHS